MRNPFEKLIVEKLKEYIKRENITQAELAKRLGWATSDISDILNCRKSIGKIRQQRIAERLGISFELSDLKDKIINVEYEPVRPKVINKTILSLNRPIKDFSEEEQKYFLKVVLEYELLRKKLSGNR